MKKGVVLEIRGNRATVLTPDGRFLRVRVPAEGWYPGDEVTWGRERSFYLRPALVMACLLVLLLVPAALAYRHFWALGPVVAYVSVDINPSLEFGVDARERVCVARALNPDGEQILTGLRWRGRSLDDVLADVTLRAVEKGYVGGEGRGAILVTVTPVASRRGGPPPEPAKGGSPPEAPAAPAAGAPGAGERPGPAALRERLPWGKPPPDPVRVRDEAVRAASRVLEQRGVRAAVKGLAASAEVREQAERLNLSAGRLALYLVAREAGIEVALEQFRTGPVAEILYEALGRQLGKDRQGDRGPEAREGQPGTKPGPPGGSTAPGAPGQGPAGEAGKEPGKPGKSPGQPGGKPPGKEPPGGKPSVGAGGGRVSPPGSGPQQPGSGQGPATGGGQGTGAGESGEVPGIQVPGLPQLPGLKLGPGELAVSPDELLEKLWEKAGLEKELPELMKKFLPPIDKHREKSGEKDKPGGR